MYVFVLTSCTNYFFNTTYRLVVKLRLSALSDCFLLFLFSLVFSFSLHGAVVSALCTLLHPQTVVRCVLYTLHLHFELLGK